MRISHHKKKEEPKKAYRINLAITSPEVLLLSKDWANLGVMKTADAMQLAKEQGMDLVEINPKITPPVVKVIDYGQFRYQMEKEARIAKAHQHIVDTKGLRLSLRIGDHDRAIRIKQSIDFLNDGNKVRMEIMLRGREMQQWQLAMDILRKFVTEINLTIATRFEQEIEKAGNKVTAIIAKS